MREIAGDQGEVTLQGCHGDEEVWVANQLTAATELAANPREPFHGKAARKTCPEPLWKVAIRKLDQLDSVTTLSELRIPPGNRLEALTAHRKGQYSIRINEQYRICLVWTNSGPDKVEIVDYH